jgi:hypothetical protein
VVALDPIIQALWAHVLSAERIHADDTTVPVLAKMKTVTGRIWTYVRDDRPFGGKDPSLAHARGRASSRTSRQLCRHHAGRCVAEMDLDIRGDTFHPEWNYTVHPRPEKPRRSFISPRAPCSLG